MMDSKTMYPNMFARAGHWLDSVGSEYTPAVKVEPVYWIAAVYCLSSLYSALSSRVCSCAIISRLSRACAILAYVCWPGQSE